MRYRADLGGLQRLLRDVEYMKCVAWTTPPSLAAFTCTSASDARNRWVAPSATAEISSEAK